MKYNEIGYVLTDGEKYIADFLDRFAMKIENVKDIFDLEIWDNPFDAEHDLNWLKTQIDSKEELKEFQKYHIEAIKINIEL